MKLCSAKRAYMHVSEHGEAIVRVAGNKRPITL